MCNDNNILVEYSCGHVFHMIIIMYMYVVSVWVTHLCVH